MKKLKSNIGWLIDNSRFTREDLKNRYKKTPNTISNWCTGKSYPSVTELYDLAELFGVFVDDLYSREEEIKDPLDEHIGVLQLSRRIELLLQRNQINTVRDLKNTNLKQIYGLGEQGTEEIEKKLFNFIGGYNNDN